jgi:zinc transport system substrate-binding protein
MKMKQGTRLAAAMLGSALALTGCATASSAPSTTASTTTKISVTVSAYPLQFLTERIIGNSGTVTDLTQPGQEPHDLELNAKQIAEMSTTDAVVYLSGFQAAVDEAIKTAAPKVAIDANAGLTLLDALPGAETASSHDPHVWLSPANMITMTQTISSKLSAAKPELASTFAANATTLVADLTTLNADYTSGLSNCSIKQFVTSHAAFGYLARDYGLEQIPIAGLDPTQEPTAARIAEVQKLAKQHHVTTIFFETLVSDVVAKSIAGDLGLKAAVLDPIEGITKASAGTNYLEVMNSNLKALQEANTCS